MKQTLLFINLLLFSILSAQNIDFTNPNLKTFLLGSKIDYDLTGQVVYPFIDNNNDGEISLQEALLVKKLNFSYTEITDLEDLQYFTNLKSILSYYANLNEFNLPSLINLEELLLQNVLVGTSPITILDFSGNTSLKKLTLSSTTTSLDLSSNLNLLELSLYCPNLTSLNLTNLENLKTLYYYGKMTTIDVSDCSNLLNLTCVGGIPSNPIPEENKITSINLSNVNKLVNLDLTGNNISNLDLSNCPNLEMIAVSYNDLTSLDLGDLAYVKAIDCNNNLLTSLDLSNFFNLQNVYCQNNQLTTLSTKNGIIEDFIDFSGNPELTSICSDANEIVYIKNQCLQNGNDESIVSDCIEPESRFTVVMYPNPVGNQLTIDSDRVISKVEVFGINSLRVMRDESGSKIIDMTNLETGMYFVNVHVGDEVSTMKLVKN